MTKLPLGLLLLASLLQAQYALWIDAGGEWRMIVNRDEPAFATPEFDDRDWPTVTLPRGQRRLLDLGTKGWLRRRVELPEGVGRGQLVLSVGVVEDVYEVYVNGVRIGATGNFDSFGDTRIPRPMIFPIPPGATSSHQPLTIAIRARHILGMQPPWRLLDEGPYLITSAAQAPVEAGRIQMQERWISLSPGVLFGSLFSILAVMAFIAWLGERQRRELLWFSIVSLARGVVPAYTNLHLLSANAQPFSASGQTLDFLFGNIEGPLLAELVLSVLVIRRPGIRLAIWLGWGLPVMIALLSYPWRPIGYLGQCWPGAVAVAAILWDWWRHRPGQMTLRFALFVQSLHTAIFWLRNGWSLFVSKSVSGSDSLIDTGDFALGSYRVDRWDVVWLFLSAIVLTILLRRLTADRRERQRLSGEVEAARAMQQLLLAKPRLSGRGLTLDVVYEPAQEVGGDFYYVLDSDVVVIGDVSGKGLRAAMLVSLLTGVLREPTERKPAGVLAALNRAVAGQIDGGFVTCCCMRFEQDGAVTAANAGHLAPYVDGREITLEAGLPLGLDPGATYAETTLALGPGASLTLLSDGVVEAANAKGELFGFDRTREISGNSPTEIADAAKAWGQNDDITVVTVRRSA